MILFKTIKYRNFLSAGDKFVSVDLDKHATTLIIGKNGEGKSLLTDAISFALYGKAYRKIKKDQLVNSINERHLEVEITFSTGAAEYKIHRGIKPNIFKIYKNGKPLNEASHARDYQSFLEQNILKMNQRAFNQIVILGSAEYIPFMQLPTWHRREVIEELLDIRVFSHMRTEIKSVLSGLNDELTELDKRVSHTNTVIKEKRSTLTNLERIRDEQNQNSEEKRSAIQLRIDTLHQEIHDCILRDNLNEIKDATIAAEAKINVVYKKSLELKSAQTRHKGTMEFFDKHSTCPTCSHDLDPKLRLDKVAKSKTKLENITEAERLADQMLTSLNETVSNNNLAIKEHEEQLRKIEMLKRRIADCNAEIVELDNAKPTASVDLIKSTAEDIDNLYLKREDLHNEKDSVSDNMRHYQAAVEMLKDTGIKQQVISQYLPVMNQLINKYLEVFEFFVLFTLDSDFNETIRSRHRDTFSYSSFSEGEKARINLALMFCWREIARIKNSAHTNLLIFDETLDQSLDNDGVEKLMTVISTIVDKSNIIVISHRAVEESAFTRTLEAKKIKNFSTLKEIQ